MNWRAGQALLSMGFSRQEYWSGLPFPSPSSEVGAMFIPVLQMSKMRLGGEVICQRLHSLGSCGQSWTEELTNPHPGAKAIAVLTAAGFLTPKSYVYVFVPVTWFP